MYNMVIVIGGYHYSIERNGICTMLKLSFNSTTLRDYDVLEACRYIRAAGYDGVELALGDAHLHPLRTSAQKVKDIKRQCADIGLDIVCLAAGGPDLLGSTRYEPSLITYSAEGRSERLDVIRRSIALAQDLGCPVVNFNSGLPREDVPAEIANDYLLGGLQQLTRNLGNTILAMEPEPDFFVGNTDKAIEIINSINHSQLRLNLDVGHVFCSQENAYEAIKRSIPYTRHIHIEDIKDAVHYHEIPGEGDIDFPRVISIINQQDYEHYISVELHNHDKRWQDALNLSRKYLLALD